MELMDAYCAETVGTGAVGTGAGRVKEMSLGVGTERLSLDKVVAELHKLFDKDEVDTAAVEGLLSAYRSDPADWRRFAFFDPHRYTRNLVDAGNGKFNLMILCWGEGMGSSVHDHANAHCFVKVLDGQLKETQFFWPRRTGEGAKEEAPLQLKAATTHPRDAVCYMSDKIGLHRMENPSHSESAVSLHLYIPPFEKCQSFDQRSGHSREVKVTFYSSRGQRTPAKPLPVPGAQDPQGPQVVPSAESLH